MGLPVRTFALRVKMAKTSPRPNLGGGGGLLRGKQGFPISENALDVSRNLECARNFGSNFIFSPNTAFWNTDALFVDSRKK